MVLTYILEKSITNEHIMQWLRSFLAIKRQDGVVVTVDEFTPDPEFDPVYQGPIFLQNNWQVIIGDVNDFSFAVQYLTSLNKLERQKILTALVILSENPSNALPILELLETVLTFEPPPNHKLTSLPLVPRYSKFWKLPTEGFHVQILYAIRRIVHHFIETSHPTAIRSYQKGLDLLETVGKSSTHPELRILALHLIYDLVFLRFDNPRQQDVIPISPHVALTKWGKGEDRCQWLLELAADSQELLPIRRAALFALTRHLTQEEGKLRFKLLETWGSKDILRLLHLVLDLLWEDPASTKWDAEVHLIKGAFKKVYSFRQFLPPPAYARLLNLLRQAVASVPPTPKSKKSAWAIIKDCFATRLVVSTFEQKMEEERLFQGLIQTPEHLRIFKNALDWAHTKRFPVFWVHRLMHAQATLYHPSANRDSFHTLKGSADPSHRREIMLLLGALAVQQAFETPDSDLSILVNAIADKDPVLRIITMEVLKYIIPHLNEPTCAILLIQAGAHDENRYVRNSAMEAIVPLAPFLEDGRSLLPLLLEAIHLPDRKIKRLPEKWRYSAIAGIAALRDKIGDLTPIITALLAQPRTAWGITDLIFSIGDARPILPAILQGTVSEDVHTRCTALKILGEIRDEYLPDPPFARATFFQALLDKEEQVRLTVLNVFRSLWRYSGHFSEFFGSVFNDSEALIAYLRPALTDESFKVRAGSLITLGLLIPLLEDPMTLFPIFREAAKDKDPKIRGQIIIELGQLAKHVETLEPIVEIFMEAKRDKSLSVRADVLDMIAKTPKLQPFFPEPELKEWKWP